tara:strand:- start:14 stop:1024 length:1011 start_codon:yes stop_codon:yes gene_type:complete
MADDTEWKSYRDEWYNDRVMETYISSPIVDKQNDLVPTKTMEDAMDFYMKYGVYSFQHEEQPIGLPLAWKTEDGKVKIKVGIHSGLEMHDHAWKQIKAYGLRGASSIRGEATEQKEVCEGEVCHNEINELGLWSVSWVEDHPANPEATVTQVAAMAKGEVCKCGGCGKTESGETLKYNTQELEGKEVDSMTEEKSDPEVVAPEETEEVKEEEETIEEEKQEEEEEEEEEEEVEASESKKDLGMVREALMAALDYLQEGVEAQEHEEEEEMEASDDTEKEELTLAKSLKVLKRHGFNVYSGSKTTPAPKINTPKAKYDFNDMVNKSWEELDRIERGM